MKRKTDIRRKTKKLKLIQKYKKVRGGGKSWDVFKRYKICEHYFYSVQLYSSTFMNNEHRKGNEICDKIAPKQ